MLYPDFAELIKLQNASTGNLLKNKYNQNSIAPGDYNSLFHGQGIEFDNVRPYIIGDDIRYINWRVTARTKKPHVKTFQAECDRKILLVVDSNHYMRFGTRGTFKSIQVARAAALLAGMGFKNRDRVGGLVFGDLQQEVEFFPPTRHKTTAWKLFKLLCQPSVEQQQPIALAYALNQLRHNLSTGTLIFLFTDVETIVNTNLDLLAAIRAKGDLVLLPVLDPIDSNLPLINHVTCVNNTNNKIYIRNVSPAMERNYSKNWGTNWRKLQEIIKKYKLKMIVLHTNKAVHRSLNDGLKQLRYY
jgi:uncharacterized protein (DUF58 family)